MNQSTTIVCCIFEVVKTIYKNNEFLRVVLKFMLLLQNIMFLEIGIYNTLQDS